MGQEGGGSGRIVEIQMGRKLTFGINAEIDFDPPHIGRVQFDAEIGRAVTDTFRNLQAETVQSVDRRTGHCAGRGRQIRSPSVSHRGRNGLTLQAKGRAAEI